MRFLIKEIAQFISLWGVDFLSEKSFPLLWTWRPSAHFLSPLQEEEGGEAALDEEDLYAKAEHEFWSIINQEKKNIEKKKEADMDKADPGKVNW